MCGLGLSPVSIAAGFMSSGSRIHMRVTIPVLPAAVLGLGLILTTVTATAGPFLV